jgi:large subunit ribosomal protein L24
MATSALSNGSKKLRAGDTVMVIAGNDKGRSGTIKQVDREAGRVIIEGINLRWKHKKPSQKSPKGERVQIEISIHASNVMHMDAAGKPTRIAPTRTEKNQAKTQPKATKGQEKGKGR